MSRHQLSIRIAAVSVAAAAALVSPVAPALAASRPTPAAVTVYVPPAGTDGAFGVTRGPGGTYFAHGATIDRIREGVITQFAVPHPATADIGWLTWDRHAEVWFADRGTGVLGTIDRAGRVREYQLPSGSGGSAVPQGIVVGPGPYVYYTDQFNDWIGRLDTQTGDVDTYAVPTPEAQPVGLIRGSDGALWFTERGVDKVGRLSVHDVFQEWALSPGAFPNRLAIGPDHAIWFTELNTSSLGRIDPRTDVLTETPIRGGPVGITLGSDGHLYTVLYGVGRLAELNTDGTIARTWRLPGSTGALQVAQNRDHMWVTDPFADLVFRVDI